MRRTVMAAILTAMLLGTLPAADWPQWRGPKRDGHSGEVGVKDKLTAKGGPKLAWTFKDAGRGNATPSVVGDRVYVLGERKGKEYVIAIDAKAGKELWAAEMSPTWDEKGTTPFSFTVGPNCGPAVEGDRLYAVSSRGTLVCVDTAKGDVVWKKDLVGDPKDPKAVVTTSGGGEEVYGYGFSWSPLIDGDKLIITPGGKLGLFAALDKKTGKEIWRGTDVTEDATYASPVVAEIGGVRQYITGTQFGPVAVDAKTGKMLWFPKLEDEIGDMVCPTPIVMGDTVLFSSTKYGTSATKVEKVGDNFKTKAAYKLVKGLANSHGEIVLVDGHIYGAHEERDWKCVEAATGKVKWSTQDPTVGPILAVDGVLVMQPERGEEVVVAAADPAAFKELNRWKLPEASKQRKPSGRLWCPPIAAAGKLFVRDQELLFAYEIK